MLRASKPTSMRNRLEGLPFSCETRDDDPGGQPTTRRRDMVEAVFLGQWTAQEASTGVTASSETRKQRITSRNPDGSTSDHRNFFAAILESGDEGAFCMLGLVGEIASGPKECRPSEKSWQRPMMSQGSGHGGGTLGLGRSPTRSCRT